MLLTPDRRQTHRHMAGQEGLQAFLPCEVRCDLALVDHVLPHLHRLDSLLRVPADALAVLGQSPAPVTPGQRPVDSLVVRQLLTACERTGRLTYDFAPPRHFVL